MRFMKRLLTAVYLYLGIFFALCLICWIVTGEEPAALIAGISAAAGVESVIAGCMRMREMQEERNRKKEKEESGEGRREIPGETSGETYIDTAWGEK